MVLFPYFLALVACKGLAAPSTLNQTHPIPVTSPSSLISPSSPSATPLSTSTVFETAVETVFETTTIDAQPSSTPLATTAATEIVTASAAAPTSLSASRNVWTEPQQMTDLSAFGITSFPTGKDNYRLVSQIPAEAFASSSSNGNTSNPATLLQIVYPAHSVNPGSKPAGGADFYATPLDLAGAHDVTLSYSVFFPADFDWVKGGKLPGLFGGHTGCSGGSAATDCFSTRLMWRPHGAGELYLYAPKDKQTSALCNDPQSVCDNDYGFSVGRGSFNFAAGDWTHVAQTVVLNTPGKNDGIFKLSVDGRLVIDRADIFYRNVVQRSKKRDTPAEFLGLFFSTFFGGHGEQYATPKEQHTWFKDFEIDRHD